jgi:transposase-like protein
LFSDGTDGDVKSELVQMSIRQIVEQALEAATRDLATTHATDLVDGFGRTHPAAVACFEEDFEACIAHLHLPPAHRQVTRTTNLLERLFVEERRRLKAALHLFGERPVMKPMYAALVRGAEPWHGVKVTEFERRQLEKLSEELQARHRADNRPVVRPAAKNPTRIYSKNRT